MARERYLLDGVVAEGGHGRILRAQDLHLERLVALKEPISQNSSTEERFLREARITGYVVSAGQDGTVRLWLDDLPQEPRELRAWIAEQARR